MKLRAHPLPLPLALRRLGESRRGRHSVLIVVLATTSILVSAAVLLHAITR